MIHPSEWCSIPSLWRNKNTRQYVRALRIEDAPTEGWIIRIKDEQLETRDVPADKFQAEYELKERLPILSTVSTSGPPDHVNHLRFESLRNIVALNERGIKIGDQVMNERGRRGFLTFSDPSLRIKFLDSFDNDLTCYDVETIKKIKA